MVVYLSLAPSSDVGLNHAEHSLQMPAVLKANVHLEFDCGLVLWCVLCRSGGAHPDEPCPLPCLSTGGQAGRAADAGHGGAANGGDGAGAGGAAGGAGATLRWVEASSCCNALTFFPCCSVLLAAAPVSALPSTPDRLLLTLALSLPDAPSADPRQRAGLYWGYTTRIAPSLAALTDAAQCPFEGGYDLTVGTSGASVSNQS